MIKLYSLTLKVILSGSGANILVGIGFYMAAILNLLC